MIETNIHDGTRYWFPQKIYANDGSVWRTVKRMFISDGESWKEIFRNLSREMPYPTMNGATIAVPCGIRSLNGTILGIFRYKYSISPVVYRYGIFSFDEVTWAWSFLMDLPYPGNTPYVMSVDNNLLYLSIYENGVGYAAYSFNGSSFTRIRTVPEYKFIICGSDIFTIGSSIQRWNGSTWVSIGLPSGVSSIETVMNVSGTLYILGTRTDYFSLHYWTGGTTWAQVGGLIPANTSSYNGNAILWNSTWYVTASPGIYKLSAGSWNLINNPRAGTVTYTGNLIGNSIYFQSWNAGNSNYKSFCVINLSTEIVSLVSTIESSNLGDIYLDWFSNNNHIQQHGGKFIFINSDSYNTKIYMWDGALTS
jgi:hypothetical protein